MVQNSVGGTRHELQFSFVVRWPYKAAPTHYAFYPGVPLRQAWLFLVGLFFYPAICAVTSCVEGCHCLRDEMPVSDA